MRLGIAAYALTLLMTVSPCAGQDQARPDTLRRVLNNFAHEHAICAAYFVVGAKCFAEDRDAELRQKLSQTGAEAINRGKDWTKRAQLKEETFTARVEMSIQTMVSKMGSDCGNISLILRDRAQSCKLLIEEPEKRIEALTDDILTRQAKGQ